MRELFEATTDNEAQIFKEILAGADIESDVRQTRDGRFSVWILEDSDLVPSKELLLEWKDSKDGSRWSDLKLKGQSKLTHAQKEALEWQKTTRKQQEKFKRGTREFVMGGVTLMVIVLCGFVALITKLGENNDVVSFFTIADFMKNDGVGGWSQWRDIKSGDVWRIISPCFIHFGLIHIVFNLLWLKDLGTRVEVIENSMKLIGLILLIGVVSNCGQAFWSPLNPKFGGMSGVVYGLLGYQWIQGKLNIRPSYRLNQQTVVLMMGWYVLCFTGLVGPIANGAHTFGLLSGCLLGFVSRPKTRRQNL